MNKLKFMWAGIKALSRIYDSGVNSGNDVESIDVELMYNHCYSTTGTYYGEPANFACRQSGSRYISIKFKEPKAVPYYAETRAG